MAKSARSDSDRAIDGPLDVQYDSAAAVGNTGNIRLRASLNYGLEMSIGGAAYIPVRGPIASGIMYVSTPVATNVTNPATWYKIAGTTTSKLLNRFTHATGRLTYSGPGTFCYLAVVAISMLSNTNNFRAYFRFAVNGTTIADSEQQRKIGTGADLGNASMNTCLTLTNGDYVEVFVNSPDATGISTFTAEKMVVTLTLL